VLWARQMRPGENAELLGHYADRQAWLLAMDEGRRLVPYPSPTPRPGPNE
jgi:hypothetical protein